MQDSPDKASSVSDVFCPPQSPPPPLLTCCSFAQVYHHNAVLANILQYKVTSMNLYSAVLNIYVHNKTMNLYYAIFCSLPKSLSLFFFSLYREEVLLVFEYHNFINYCSISAVGTAVVEQYFLKLLLYTEN